jgi:hypothetical protein
MGALEGLDPPSCALVERVANENGTFEPPQYLEWLLRAGSQIEGGTFTRIVLHDGSALGELDLRPFRAIEELSANAVGWKRKLSRLVLGEQPKLKKLLEARVAEGDFATAEVAFEGATTDEPRIPAAMCQKVAAEA